MEKVKFINVDDLMDLKPQINLAFDRRCSGKTAPVKASCLKWVNEEISNLQVSINMYRRYLRATVDPYKVRQFKGYLSRFEQKQQWYKYIRGLIENA